MGYISKYDLNLYVKTIQNLRASSCNVVSYPKPSEMPAETNWTTYMFRLCQLATILTLFHSYSCVDTRPEKGHRHARNKQHSINWKAVFVLSGLHQRIYFIAALTWFRFDAGCHMHSRVCASICTINVCSKTFILRCHIHFPHFCIKANGRTH